MAVAEMTAGTFYREVAGSEEMLVAYLLQAEVVRRA